jgi:hypothetical protein
MNKLIHNNTPVERHEIPGGPVYVKREDLAVSPPAPPFSKMRGLIPVLEALKANGIEHVGYTETNVSMAGWGVAWGCAQLGLTAVIFDPQYKTPQPLLDLHRKHWEAHGALTVPVPAGRAKVNWYRSRKIMLERYAKRGHLLPLGLPFDSSIDETYKEAIRTRIKCDDYETVVVNVGSGTICAGLVRAFRDKRVIGVMGRSGSVSHKAAVIEKKSGVVLNGMVGAHVQLIDPGWEYTARSKARCPFPCHPWYDLKAWQWLTENREEFTGPVLFWNIGQIGRAPKKGVQKR